MSRPALFLDRDGVINVDHAYVHRREDFDFIDGIFDLVAAACRSGYAVIVVTNQAGIGRGYYSEADFLQLMDWVRQEFRAREGEISAVYFCPNHPVHGIGSYRLDTPMRKPGPGMFLRAAAECSIALEQSLMVGDKANDMTAARTAGIRRRFLLSRDEPLSQGDCRVASLADVIPHLL